MEQLPEAFIHTFVQQNIEPLFYFSLKKTGSHQAAEELTADIVFQIVSALYSGHVPVNFSAWMWQIARNRFSMWVKKQHRQRATMMELTEEIGGGSPADSIENMAEYKETVALLRRELSLISFDYREVLVRYYIENRSVKQIASMLCCSEGTVKSKLFRGRKILKEGMNMAREFGQKSYKPEEIDFAASGNQPSGLPWSAVNRKIPKNILLHTNNNPATIEELSIELGIAAPYMEEEVQLLCNATLLQKIGNRVITNFYIMSAQCRQNIYKLLRQNSKQRSEWLNAMVEDSLPAIRNLAIDDCSLKWWLVIYTLDFCIENTTGYCIEWPRKRENGETWGFMGYEKTTLPESVVMGHNGSGNENCMFWAYKISDYGMWDQIGEIQDYNAVLFLGDCLQNKRNVNSFSESEQKLWQKLAGKYAHADETGIIVPDIIAVTRQQLKELRAIIKQHPNFTRIITDLGNVLNRITNMLHPYSHEAVRQYIPYSASMEILTARMMAVHDLVESGNLLVPQDPTHTRCGMHLVLN